MGTSEISGPELTSLADPSLGEFASKDNVRSNLSRESSQDAPGFFNNRRARTPSVLVTSDFSNGPYANPPLHHADSVTTNNSTQDAVTTPTNVSNNVNSKKKGCSEAMRSCGETCCSPAAKKIYYGILVTVLVTVTWVGATHCIKYLYFRVPASSPAFHTGNSSLVAHKIIAYNAPFFTTWFITNWTLFFFPIYFLTCFIKGGCKRGGAILGESMKNFREKGFTAGRFMVRCSLFCLLWVATNYMYVYSLKSLLASDVITLFATNVSSVYLLSWVILHEQFVGVRIVAVILCDTGVALFAYMDGITGSPTLGGVVLAVIAASGSAVYKVLFKKFIGEASYGQVAFFFSLIGLLNATLLWPLCLTLYLTGAEVLFWHRIPWLALLGASFFTLAANLLGNFSCAVTYDLFITLGLITAVPVSAAVDVILYSSNFVGMKLAGMILIAVGFFLVMFPDNWPDYITRLLSGLKKRSSAESTSFQHRQHLLARDLSD